MTFLEKLTAVTFVTIGLALVLTNPTGTTAAGAAGGNLYQSIVGAFYKPK